SYTFTKPGEYEFYVDVKKNDVTVSKSCKVNVSSYWNYNASVSANSCKLGNTVNVTASSSGSNYGAKYKFVYEYNNWKQWGVIQGLSADNTVTFKPPYGGQCSIYVDVNCNGVTKTKVLKVNVHQDAVVKLSNSSATIPQGKSLYLKKESVSPSSAKITFVSSNTNVATVESNTGYIYAKSTGSATINALDSGGSTVASCAVTVIAAEPIRFAYTEPNCVSKGSTVTLYATTDTTRDAVRFYVNGTYYDVTSYTTENNIRIWSKQISTSNLATGKAISVNAYSRKNGSWSTCSAGNTSIFVTTATSPSIATCENRRVSSKGIQFIAEMEGFSASVYDDAGGTPTLGYGNVIYGGEMFYNNYTKKEGMAELVNLINETDSNGNGYSGSVNKLLVENGIKCNQYQFDALSSYSYNKGYSWATKWFADTYPERASLRAKVLGVRSKNLNSMTYAEKEAFIYDFNSAHSMASNGQCLPGLLYRRINELELFFDGDYVRSMNATQNKNSKYYKVSCSKCNL
ncbi:MAG: Ig-like domain-containing protein, partial [Lachnospiraceae bacterium]|nr:Ig-like domain-containing protein [Lachnospiraceae bacterium]